MELPAYRIAAVIGVKNDRSTKDKTRLAYLLTDSRDLTYPAKTLFFALKTDVNDGHNYIPELYAKGVRYFVVDKDIDPDDYPEATLWKVPNVLYALQRLAEDVRSLFAWPVVGITGSRGKTIVKELIYISLRSEYEVVRSPRSYNSQIGVPLSVWDITPNTTIAVFEAGISRTAEMSRLQKIIRPTIGVFTSLTSEHDEGFSSLREKAEEKAILFSECHTVYYEADSPNADIIREAVTRSNPTVLLIPIKGGNKAIAGAVAERILRDMNNTSYISEALKLIADSNDKIRSRIDVTETLKNCVIVYDSFTGDLRSTYDALNYTRRHMTPGRKLTLILTTPDEPISEYGLAELIKAKGVSRFIGVSPYLNRFKCDGVKVENVYTVDDFINRYTISDFSDEVILVKGSNRCPAEDIKYLLEAPRHETVMEVDLGAITRNFNFFRSKVKPTTGMIAMVKANGYGVGALELAKTLQNQGAAYLAVAVVDEGVELRRGGITMPIIVMNPISTNYKSLFGYHLEPSVFSIRELRLLLDNAARLGITEYPVHIKLDTGMHRLGFLESELDQLIDVLSLQSQVRVSSIFSHLATADCLDQDEYTEMQLSTFDRMSSRLVAAIPYPVMRHILNTAGILRYPQYQYDMVRLGIGLYGVAPIDGYRLETVARLLSTIISLKTWLPGATIGYGRRGKITSPTVIATVAIGYADGLDRHLSCGNAYLLVNGKQCPIVGNICMDQCMVDVTGADAEIGDTVEIFGQHAPIERLSDTLGTIPYEILTSVSPRVKRIYFRE